MRRHLPMFLAVVSLILCLYALAGWVRSYLGEAVLIGSLHGCLGMGSVDASHGFIRQVLGDASDDQFMRELEGMASTVHRQLGFAYLKGDVNGASYWIVEVPYWLIVGLTTILPLRLWMQHRRRKARVRAGQCLGCGYDLRATPNGRCPECGMEAATARPVPANGV